MGECSINEKQLRKIAPGLSRGLRSPGVEDEIFDLNVDEQEGVLEEALKEQVCLVNV